MRKPAYLLAALATGVSLLGAPQACALSERPSEYELKRREAMRQAEKEARERRDADRAKAPPPADSLVFECRYLHMLGDKVPTETAHWSLAPNHFHEWDKHARAWGPNQCVAAGAGMTKVTCVLAETEVRFVGTLAEATGYARELKWTLDRTTGEFKSIDIAWLKRVGDSRADLYANKNGVCRPSASPR